MWLINAITLELEEFIEAKRGSYAILSHTWEEEEVSFVQFRTHGSSALDPVRRQKGFLKIVETCKIASQQGVPYVWVDTCCIDKSSSAELTEAINSMFKYYECAAFCIAFISDLEKHPDTEESASHLERCFPRCRWLTRGWTLQELIAPGQVMFFDASWSFRGSKSGFMAFLSRETGIDIEVLENPFNLRLVPLARRMSWASKRQTTRVEDMAYSLLGIFDVNMPLVYGEGRKAFARLQEEIIRESHDLSLFAWRQRGRFPKYRGIFADSPAEFLDCRSLMNLNKGALLSNEILTTNKGLRIDVTLLYYAQLTDEFIWNLGCSHLITPSDGIGICLVKTKDGFVRGKPDQVFEASHAMSPFFTPPPQTVHIRKTVPSFIESITITQRFFRAIKLRLIDESSSARLKSVAPTALWHEHRHLFLGFGEGGLNAFIRFEMRDLSSPTPFFIVCSTAAENPFCAVRVRGFDLNYHCTEIENVMRGTDMSIFTAPLRNTMLAFQDGGDDTTSSRCLELKEDEFLNIKAELTKEWVAEDDLAVEMFVLQVSFKPTHVRDRSYRVRGAVSPR